MSGYGRFACYYDKLTENVDYGKIAARCHEFIKRYSSEHEVVLDLACGFEVRSVKHLHVLIMMW